MLDDLGTPGPGASPHIDNVDLPSWQAQVQGYPGNQDDIIMEINTTIFFIDISWLCRNYDSELKMQSAIYFLHFY